MSSSRPPSRNLGALGVTYYTPGTLNVQKEKTPSVPLSGEYDHLPYVHDILRGKPKEATVRRPKAPKRPYAELRAASAFSFLDGSSLPEDLIAQAAMQDLPAMALIERNGVYGAPRFFMAAKKTGVTA